MANVQSGNTLFFDSTGTLNSGRRTRVTALIFTASSANFVCRLVDPLDSGDVVKLDVDLSDSGNTKLFDLSSNPILFQKGVKVSSITNGTLTIIYNEA